MINTIFCCGGWTIINPNTTNSYYSFQSNEVIQYLISNTTGNQYYLKIKQTSSTYNSSTNNGSIYYSTMHQNWTKFLILLSNRNKIPSSYTSVVEFGLGGCGYSGASTYLNMPDGTIGAKGTLGYR